jgi:site-specific DNA-methyltransferase (adenine-specific)
MNKLYFGDNLAVLKEHIEPSSVDLIYLDPPFNSQATYNILFKSPREDAVSAQASAFLDFWSWGIESEAAYHALLTEIGGNVATLMKALRAALHDSDMMAYLVMMAVRLVELHRALKPEGSLYLHCDPNASHYLKLTLDSVFGPRSFKSEVIWKRSSAHNSARRWGPTHDVLLFYTKSDKFTWNKVYQAYDPHYVDEFYTHKDPDHRRWRRSDLTGAGVRGGETGKPWRGIEVTPKKRHWFVPPARLDKLDEAGKIHWPAKEGGMPMLKRYLDEQPGVQAQDLILDIPPLHNLARERLGYPTQKPLALLERLIMASSNVGQVILDPFCGCGTSVDAAQALDRQWVGIDVSIHAVHVIENRLRARFGATAVPKPDGIPADYDAAAALAASLPFQFQWWANYLIGVHYLKEVKKGADRGIDGELFFPNGPGRPYGRLLTSVKGGRNVNPAMVREFRGVIEREKADLGLFICLEPPTPEMAREAIGAGFGNVVHGRIPRLQVVSIRDWFDGRRPALPPREQLPYAAFSAPGEKRRVRRPDPNEPELPFSFIGGKANKNVVGHLNPDMVTAGEGELALG